MFVFPVYAKETSSVMPEGNCTIICVGRMNAERRFMGVSKHWWMKTGPNYRDIHLALEC